MIKKVIGVIILAGVFLGLIAATAYEYGIKEALFTWGAALTLATLVIIGIDLIIEI